MMARADNEKRAALRELMNLMRECQGLDAEIRFSAQHQCFSVTVWRGWDSPDPENQAKEIQTQVKELARQYPRVVCYCFDEFSTLLYVV